MDDSEMAETGTGLYDGFEGYRTATDAEYHCLLTSGLVIPDTNVFLNLYRYNEQTRSDLLTVLSGLGKRLWVPRQVMEEFWRNREGVLRDPRDTEKTATELMGQREKAVITFRRWANRVGLPPQRGNQLIKVLTGAFDEVISGVGELADREASQFARDTNKDPVLASLEPILYGNIGRAMDKADYAAAMEEAKKRGVEKRPPGYKDADKQDSAAAGDYLVWTQILREAKLRERDVLMVTGDVKEDWWRREHGELRGPRPELVDEMRVSAGVRLFMIRPETLLLYGSQVLQVEVRQGSVEDIERVTQAAISESSLTVSIDRIKPGAEPVLIQVSPDSTVSSVLDTIYYSLSPAVSARTYAKSWILVADDGNEYSDIGTAWAQSHNLSTDERPISEVGIVPGLQLTAVPLQERHRSRRRSLRQRRTMRLVRPRREHLVRLSL
jgi:PIN like domain